jgi:hypothetical protein
MNTSSREYPLFNFAGLKISAVPSALVGSIVLWLLFTMIAIIATDLSLGGAIIAGFIMMLLHCLFEIIHQLGHAWAARRVGYPMVGIRLYLALGASVYPPTEGDLPAHVHIQRALGGPIISTIVMLLAGILVVILSSAGEFFRFLAWFAFFVKLLFFSLGAIIPFPLPNLLETDGTTLLRWWPKR